MNRLLNRISHVLVAMLVVQGGSLYASLIVPDITSCVAATNDHQPIRPSQRPREDSKDYVRVPAPDAGTGAFNGLSSVSGPGQLQVAIAHQSVIPEPTKAGILPEEAESSISEGHKFKLPKPPKASVSG